MQKKILGRLALLLSFRALAGERNQSRKRQQIWLIAGLSRTSDLQLLPHPDYWYAGSAAILTRKSIQVAILVSQNARDDSCAPGGRGLRSPILFFF